MRRKILTDLPKKDIREQDGKKKEKKKDRKKDKED